MGFRLKVSRVYIGIYWDLLGKPWEIATPNVALCEGEKCEHLFASILEGSTYPIYSYTCPKPVLQ